MVGIVWDSAGEDVVCALLGFAKKNRVEINKRIITRLYFIAKLSNNNVTDELLTRQYTKVCKKKEAGFIEALMVK